MTELTVLLVGEQMDLLPRTEFNHDVESLLLTVDAFDPIYAAALADRLTVLATAIKDRVKETAAMMLLAHDKTTNLYGDTFTLTEKNVYVYPADSQIKMYEQEIENISKKIEPLQNELKGYTESMKSHEKQLIADGRASIIETNYQYAIKKK